MLIRREGTAESMRLQVAMLAAVTGRWSQRLETSTYWPLVRTTPPSEPRKTMSGLVGWKAIAWESGWSRSGAGWASQVMSVKVRSPLTGSGSPAVVERTTARPFERPPISPYW